MTDGNISVARRNDSTRRNNASVKRVEARKAGSVNGTRPVEKFEKVSKLFKK